MNVMHDISQSNPKAIFKKPYEFQRRLVENAFSGTDSEGRRLGVNLQEKDGGWDFEIRVTLENTLFNLLISDEYLINSVDIDSDCKDVQKELEEIRSNINKCSSGGSFKPKFFAI